MRMRCLIGVAVFLMGSFWTKGQHLDDWLAVSAAQAEETAAAARKLNSFTEGLRETTPGSHRQLAKVFRKVHATYLKKYEAYTDFRSLIDEGRFDCLTATMLFSEVLTHLGYECRIVETNYHIFILVHTTEGQVLLESTDKMNGFVTDAATIARRTASYREIVPRASEPSFTAYQFQSQVFQEVSLENLTGLLYFNQAVKAYNGGDWLASARFLEESFLRYPTGRCLELGDILVSTLVARKDVSHEMRRTSMEHLMPLLLRRSGKVAANEMD